MELSIIETSTLDDMFKSVENFTQNISVIIDRVKKIDDEQWLDNEDVCRILNVSKRTLQKYRDNGTLPYSQNQHKCYYKASDIEELVNSKRVESL